MLLSIEVFVGLSSVKQSIVGTVVLFCEFCCIVMQTYPFHSKKLNYHFKALKSIIIPSSPRFCRFNDWFLTEHQNVCCLDICFGSPSSISHFTVFIYFVFPFDLNSCPTHSPSTFLLHVILFTKLKEWSGIHKTWQRQHERKLCLALLLLPRLSVGGTKGPQMH